MGLAYLNDILHSTPPKLRVAACAEKVREREKGGRKIGSFRVQEQRGVNLLGTKAFSSDHGITSGSPLWKSRYP